MNRKAHQRRQLDKSLLNDAIVDEWIMVTAFVPDCHHWVTVEGCGRYLAADFKVLLKTPAIGFSSATFTKLYATFAATPATEAGFEEFANKYGLLGLKSDQKQLAGDELRNSWAWGEPWIFWEDAHIKISAAADLLERIQRNEFSDVLTCRKGGWWWHQPGPFPDTAKKHMEAIFRPMQLDAEGELTAPEAARLFLQKMVNRGLDGGRSVAQMVWHPGRNKFVFRVRPVGLLGLLWWQIARVASGQVEYRQCPICGKVLEIAKGQFTKARMYCDPACKMRHRRAVNKAKQLAKGGVKVNAIAEQMNTDAATVRAWLKDSK